MFKWCQLRRRASFSPSTSDLISRARYANESTTIITIIIFRSSVHNINFRHLAFWHIKNFNKNLLTRFSFAIVGERFRSFASGGEFLYLAILLGNLNSWWFLGVSWRGKNCIRFLLYNDSRCFLPPYRRRTNNDTYCTTRMSKNQLLVNTRWSVKRFVGPLPVHFRLFRNPIWLRRVGESSSAWVGKAGEMEWHSSI